MRSLPIYREVLLQEAKKSCIECAHSAMIIHRGKILATGHNYHRFSRMFGNKNKSYILCG